MRTPKIYKYIRKNGTSFKAFEVKITYRILYSDLLITIMYLLKDNFCDEHTTEIEMSKTEILKQLQNSLYEYGSGDSWKTRFNEELTATEEEFYTRLADKLIKQYWFEIWEDRHKK